MSNAIASAPARATEHKNSPTADPAAVAVDITSAGADDLEARRNLAFESNHQIRLLAEGMKRLIEREGDEESPMLVGMLSRIQQLSDIVFFAARLHGDDPEEFGEHDGLQGLKRAFDGMMP